MWALGQLTFSLIWILLMKTPKKSFPYTVMFIGIVLFFSIFVGAGLMGENHRIDDLINEHFTKFKDENYSTKCFPISIDSRVVKVEEDNLCNNQNFLLYISLLKKFELIGGGKYSVNIKRNSFWIPFIKSENISVSISLQKESDKSWIPFVGNNNEVFINDLFTVKRNKWNWDISRVVVIDPDLVKIFTGFETSLDFNKFIEKTDTKYQFNSEIIDSENITDIEKRLLRFNLQKVAELLK